MEEIDRSVTQSQGRGFENENCVPGTQCEKVNCWRSWRLRNGSKSQGMTLEI